MGLHYVIGPLINIDEKVCECCPTSSVRYDDNLVIAYRNRDSNEVRDIFIARKVGGNWMNPYPVYKDNWQIAGCPVNGPMLAINESILRLLGIRQLMNLLRLKLHSQKMWEKHFQVL